MKILFSIAYFYPSQKGGPANSIYWLAKALKNKGVQNTIVTTDAGVQSNSIPAGQWIQTEAGSVIYIKERNYTLWPKLIRTSIAQVKKSDIVHLTSLFAFPSLILDIVSVAKRKKTVWSPRGELDDQALIYSNWKKKPVLAFVKRFLANAVTFHGTSQEEIKHIHHVFGSHASVMEIPNLIELPPLLDRQPEPNKYLLYIGRIHPIKALDNLMRALSASRLFMGSDYTFLIAGISTGNYEHFLQNLVNGLNLQAKVKFIGQVEGEAKQLLFANAYFTFLTSHTENFGNVVVESLAQGTPVVTSKGTPWEILSGYNAGFWVENTEASLSEVIDEVIAMDAGNYLQMRQNARQLCEDQFDVNKNIDKWIDKYSEILHG